ncbi:tryptophan-rich sensory protein [Pseudokineococcus sp. 1T1Z-3]|uniref:tryptophan-rich sensory protein n=1 Tax=Pseudokineococcus sp. 1T1Z-3 TaxID=3132745 RepID=UPI0030B5CE10
MAAQSGLRSRAASRADRARQWAVLAGAVVAAVVAFVGSGALGGTPIDEAAGGALSATSTLVAPAGPAFSIWGVVYAGLLACAVWQLAVAPPSDPRQRQVGWWLIASLLLNALWIVVVRAGSVLASVLVIGALVAVLAVALARLARTGAGSARRGPGRWVEALLVDGVTGLYLGWVLVATVANVASWLVQAGAGGLVLGEVAWAVVVLALAAGLASWVCWRTGRLAPALSASWGLAWIGVGRASGELTSGVVAVVAALAALVVLGAGVTARVRAGRATPA